MFNYSAANSMPKSNFKIGKGYEQLYKWFNSFIKKGGRFV